MVPTMGYLHEGHQSLIAKSVAQNDRTVVSIFLNPIQFGPTEDLESYPRDPERDAKLCEDTGADLIFRPDVSDMYYDDFCTFADMDIITKIFVERADLLISEEYAQLFSSFSI